MERIEILVEETSMKEFLILLLPRVLPDNWILNHNYFIRSFEGKQDLQKGIPNKIKVFSNWRREKVGVVILQDQDSSDCKELKEKLVALCEQNGNCPKLVRIVCKELEAWYIGDFEAVSKAYRNFTYQNYVNRAKFRNPDECNAYNELKRILPEFQKVSGAKKIAPFIDVERNKSESFKQTIQGIKEFFNLIKGSKKNNLKK